MNADLIYFKSENKPNNKTIKQNRINDKILSSTIYKNDKNKNIPPDKGILFLEVNL